MKTVFTFGWAFALSMISVCADAQHSLQLDDGAGHYSVITAATSGAVTNFSLPNGGGTLLTSGSLPSLAWMLGGNSSTSPNNQIGTTDATSLQFVTAGVSNVRMSIDPAGLVSIGASNEFQVDNSGNLIKINGVSYSWPASQAAVSGMVLGNDGTGTLTWVAQGSTLSPTANSDYTGGSSLSAAITNDLTISANASYFRISSSGNTDITGINSSGAADGRLVIIVNVGTNTITLKHQDAGSAAANRFDLPGGGDVILGPRGSATIIYDGSAGRWNLVSTN
jgi:hypothetical protein